MTLWRILSRFQIGKNAQGVFSMRILAISIIFILSLPTLVFANKTQVYRLPNGMKILVREDHRAPVVLTSIWYKVGGAYESNGITGISHLLEHMMFKGTKQFGAGVLNKMISDVGGTQNAITSSDYTVYYQKLPANQLEQSFKLESDRMHGLLFDKTAFTKEKQVVIEERRMRVDDNPQGVMWERFRAAAFVNNPYHHPVIGWRGDIDHLTLDDLKQWYRNWYVPNNATLVVVGDVTSDRVFDLAQKYFGPLQAGHIPKLKPRKEIKSLGKRTVNVNVPAQTSWLMMGFNVPSLPNINKKDQDDIYALKLAALVLSGGESGRLNSHLVRQSQVAVSATASYDTYSLHNDLFLFVAIPAASKKTNTLESAILNEINLLKTKLIAKSELKRVKAQLLANDVYQRDSLMKVAFHLGVPSMVGLSWRDRDDFVKRISVITPLKIQQVVKKYLKTENMTVATLTPKKNKEKN